MNNVKITDSSFINTDVYREFMQNNTGSGNLNINASFAQQALPIPNLKVSVSKNIGNYNVTFLEGLTNNSGTLGKIKLPTPPRNNNDMQVPLYTEYKITAKYNNKDYEYNVKMYDGICVVQNINIVLNSEVG